MVKIFYIYPVLIYHVVTRFFMSSIEWDLRNLMRPLYFVYQIFAWHTKFPFGIKKHFAITVYAQQEAVLQHYTQIKRVNIKLYIGDKLIL